MPEPNPAENATRKSAPPPQETFTFASGRTGVGAPTASTSQSQPQKIGRFEIRRLLGEGAFARVFLGFDPELEREVAVKVPKVEELTPEFRDTFLRENRLAAIINHPNICPVYEVGTDGGVPYIVMRVVSSTLAGVLKKLTAPLPPRNAVAVARKLALGLAAAHAQKVVHRDLKPANVLYDDNAREVLIADFGLARFIDRASEASNGVPKGTPAYMSPEQARGQAAAVGPLSDVYSLGVILFEMLTGGVPFRGSVWEVMRDHCETMPPTPSALQPGLDPKLDGLCLKALAKNPADRYSSAKAFAAALADNLRGTEQVEVAELAAAESRPPRSPAPDTPAVQTWPAPLPVPVPQPVPVVYSLPEPEPQVFVPRRRPRKRGWWVPVAAAALLLAFGAAVGLAYWWGSKASQTQLPPQAELESASRSNMPPAEKSRPAPAQPKAPEPEPKAKQPEPKAKEPDPAPKTPEPKQPEPKAVPPAPSPPTFASLAPALRAQALADYDRGEEFFHGRGVAQDYAKAREAYEKAAALGHPDAQFSLGYMYAKGRGAARDYAKAREWYEKAAVQNHARAQNNLGVLYENGEGVARDYAKAREWYEKSAAQGNSFGQTSLGDLYEDGKGVPVDFARARALFEQAANQGHDRAQFRLGYMYDIGRGVAKDYVKAREWYEKAAAQDHATALNNLGVLYKNGEGVTRNYAKAKEYFQKAADLDDDYGQANLGELYENGNGVARNLSTALDYYRKAAAQGNERAKKALARLEKK